MARVAQLGIALATLGAMIALMGLFPRVTGVEPTIGIGVIQIFAIIIGFSLLILGGLIYVKFMFYPTQNATLSQQIGIRLALTGLLFASISGLADALGFGSHTMESGADILLGPWQAVGLIGSFVVSSLGVILYALSGNPDTKDDEDR
jgi:hypothetical protein